MNRTKELKRLAYQTFPSYGYSLKERINYRKNLYNDILSYQDSHPDCTIEDIKSLFCDNNEIAAFSSDSVCLHKRFKIIGFSILLLMLACFIFLLFSNTWQPSVEYFKL